MGGRHDASGVATGSLLGDPERLGLDAAFPALFLLALLAGQLAAGAAVVAALAGAASRNRARALVPPGVPVVAAWAVAERTAAPAGRGARRDARLGTRSRWWACARSCSRAFGPLAIGGRALPRPLLGVVELLAPTLLAALIVTQAFADGRHLALDARAAGLGAAAAAVALRAPVLVVVGVAAGAAALTRALA